MPAGASDDDYDELGLFAENAAEFGIPWNGPPEVRRQAVEVAPGRSVSSLVWGSGPPELVLVHGGAQNAHTWDTVALALGHPLLAVDLPGHGHSDGGPHGAASARHHAADLAVVVRQLAPAARAVVGMSLGGLTALALSARFPELVRKLVLVDITPGVNREKASAVTSFVNGPTSFESFDAMLARTKAFNPTRSEASLRRGILHNAVRRSDGRWVWRYARFRDDEAGVPPELGDLWQAVSAVGEAQVPLLLVRGGGPGSVVDDHDEAELRRRAPSAEVSVVDGAGHSVQGDRPVELAELIRAFVLDGEPGDQRAPRPR